MDLQKSTVNLPGFFSIASKCPVYVLLIRKIDLNLQNFCYRPFYGCGNGVHTDLARRKFFLRRRFPDLFTDAFGRFLRWYGCIPRLWSLLNSARGADGKDNHTSAPCLGDQLHPPCLCRVNSQRSLGDQNQVRVFRSVFVPRCCGVLPFIFRSGRPWFVSFTLSLPHLLLRQRVRLVCAFIVSAFSVSLKLLW